MPVRPPRHTDIGALVAALASPDPIVRDSAAARLLVVGRRALPALASLSAEPQAPAGARSAALRTAAQIDGREGQRLAADASSSGVPALTLEAVAILRQSLTDGTPADSADLAVEHLTRLALDRTVPDDCRQAAVAALETLPGIVRRPLIDALALDDEATAAPRAATPAAVEADLLVQWTDAGRLPSSPDVVETALLAAAGPLPVTALLRLVVLVRASERDTTAEVRGEWGQLRDRLHEWLAARPSTIALYDLREALEDYDRPVSTHLLSAAATLADQTCLDAIAVRWVGAHQDVWLRDQLERLFRSVVVRARLRRRSATLVQLLKRHPAAAPLVAIAPRTLNAATQPAQ